jgi:hypothetical protein
MKPTDRLQQYRGQLRQVVVFMAGGGSYYEYECMQRLEKEFGENVQIIYGADYLYSPGEFVHELQKTHKK